MCQIWNLRFPTFLSYKVEEHLLSKLLPLSPPWWNKTNVISEYTCFHEPSEKNLKYHLQMTSLFLLLCWVTQERSWSPGFSSSHWKTESQLLATLQLNSSPKDSTTIKAKKVVKSIFLAQSNLFKESVLKSKALNGHRRHRRVSTSPAGKAISIVSKWQRGSQ